MRTTGRPWRLTSVALGLVLAGAASADPPVKQRSPLVEELAVDGTRGARAVFTCHGAAPGTGLEVEAGITPFGPRPLGPRVVATVTRREGLVSCTGEDGARGALRLHPMRIRAVTPSFAADAPGPRIVLAVDGQALGPRVATDDDVYVVWRGEIVAARTLAPRVCPEARWADERVVVCLDPARVRGRGPAAVRVQAAGRLAEAGGAPVALPTGVPR